jgi:hypothetical protein
MLIQLTPVEGEPILINPAGIISVGTTCFYTHVRIWGNPANVMQCTVDVYVKETPNQIERLIEGDEEDI